MERMRKQDSGSRGEEAREAMAFDRSGMVVLRWHQQAVARPPSKRAHLEQATTTAPKPNRAPRRLITHHQRPSPIGYDAAYVRIIGRFTYHAQIRMRCIMIRNHSALLLACSTTDWRRRPVVVRIQNTRGGLFIIGAVLWLPSSTMTENFTIIPTNCSR